MFIKFYKKCSKPCIYDIFLLFLHPVLISCQSMKRVWFVFLLLLSVSSARVLAVEVSMSAEEKKLYNLLMEYRAEKNLPPIPISPALTYVAQTHARDMQAYPPKGDCNLHSWSEHGSWSAVCYTKEPTEAAKKAVWNKPRELTTYPGAGYEISFWNSSGSTAQSALKSWQKSTNHNAMMINLNDWSQLTWRAVGVGIYKEYAVVWFGEEEDGESPETQPAPIQVVTDPELERQLKEMEQQMQHLQEAHEKTVQQDREIEELKAEIDRMKKAEEKKDVNDLNAYKSLNPKPKSAPEKKIQEPKPQPVKEPKQQAVQQQKEPKSQPVKEPQPAKEPKPKKDHSDSWVNRYFNRSGYSSLSYLSVGYMYSCMDGHHLVNASILDFRATLIGFSLLNVEMAVSPFNKRFAYKPALRIYIPVYKYLSVVPYGGAEIDASYIGKYFDKNYTYDETKDFYINAVGGVALNLTAARHVPMEIKVEYRHALLERANGALSPKGIYVGAQIYFGSVFKKK